MVLTEMAARLPGHDPILLRLQPWQRDLIEACVQDLGFLLVGGLCLTKCPSGGKKEGSRCPAKPVSQPQDPRAKGLKAHNSLVGLP